MESVQFMHSQSTVSRAFLSRASSEELMIDALSFGWEERPG